MVPGRVHEMVGRGRELRVSLKLFFVPASWLSGGECRLPMRNPMIRAPTIAATPASAPMTAPTIVPVLGPSLPPSPVGLGFIVEDCVVDDSVVGLGVPAAAGVLVVTPCIVAVSSPGTVAVIDEREVVETAVLPENMINTRVRSWR